MSNVGFKGIDVRQTGNQLVFRASLKDVNGAIYATPATSLYLFELQSDGTLKSYDFSSNTFKTTALTTASAAMTHQTGNNGTYNTGIWTYALATLTGFTKGSIYLAQVVNSGAMPPAQEREFQYGAAEGDLVVTSGNMLEVDVEQWQGGTVATPNVTGYPLVDVEKWGGAAVAGAIPPDSPFTHSGTCQAGSTSTTIKLDAGASSVDGFYANQVVFIRSGTGAGQSATLASYVGATRVGTINGSWAVTPDATSVVTIEAAGSPTATVTGTVTLGGADSDVIQSGIAAAATSTTLQLASALGHAIPAFGAKLRLTSGPGSPDTRVVASYVDSPNPVVTVDRAFTVTPTTATHYALVYDDAPATNATLGVTVATEYRCRFVAGLTTTAGTAVRFVVWLEDWNGNFIEQTTGATCTVTVVEAVTGTALFTFSPTLRANGRFEDDFPNPGFAADRVYSVQVTIVDAAAATHGPTQDGLEVMG